MEEEKSKKTVDMIHGTLGDKMLKVAVPLALTGILQQLFKVVQML